MTRVRADGVAQLDADGSGRCAGLGRPAAATALPVQRASSTPPPQKQQPEHSDDPDQPDLQRGRCSTGPRPWVGAATEFVNDVSQLVANFLDVLDLRVDLLGDLRAQLRGDALRPST